ncbi:hypothetical protein LR48_Vigan04g194300 [Vigna angularis]|uniref:Uncharacterized protein n=2 Tax=Phaseolus angularis TaxID=3914 RepID=A0A0L9UFQ6_PHAAN|nr:uncharacterized protein LOC108331081 isoform X1 [Vigna angularis]KAG2399988.1 uncharacterized protein HKW66_Vig0101580 [Vigna angularis]KOM41745.1 hypothetical protein LR48_Vigan04g194300 [Vigna angularis]BAT78488.1 hypothetical protein VIGAN_02117100 [Vigna angularis var. angularis]
MDLSPHVDDCIKQTIDHSLGIPIPAETLEAKLRASQDSQWRLRECLRSVKPQLERKDRLINCFKSEASMNAQALKKFVEENHRLALECDKLVAQRCRLENECALYDKDREALMEFGNDADERAREAQSQVLDLQQDLLFMHNEVQKYKQNHELVQSSACPPEETNLLGSVLASLITRDDDATYAFFQANSENESCKKLLNVWKGLSPSTLSILSLVAKVKSLEKDKEHLRTNLHKAEEEVKVLFNENNVLEKENKRLLMLYKERNHPDSAEKHTNSPSAKSNKRKSVSPRTNSPMRNFDLDDQDLARQPLSPLRHNSPDCRMRKK